MPLLEDVPKAINSRDSVPEGRCVAWSSEGDSPCCSSSTRTFAVDLDNMKKQMKEALTKKEYNVHDLYHKSGIAQWVAKHPVFENFTLFVISLNALWISYDTDYNSASVLTEAHVQFQIAEHSFCAFFTFEWIVRFLSFARKSSSLQDAWFVFDTALVFMMVMETWVLTIVMAFAATGQGGGLGGASILRLFRLLRLSRMARMLRSMPELLIMIKGIVAATRAVMFTLLLLLGIMYVFGIACRQLSEKTVMGEQYFRTVGRSMYTLLVSGTFLDNLGSVSDAILAESTACIILFYIFILLASCVLMNMLIGVLCEVVAAVSEVEKEGMALGFVASTLERILREADKDGDMMISKKEFCAMLTSREALLALKEVDIDPLSLIDFTDDIFGEDGTDDVSLSFSDFLQMVLEYRQTNSTTVKDFIELRKFVSTSFARIEEALSSAPSSPSLLPPKNSAWDPPTGPGSDKLPGSNAGSKNLFQVSETKRIDDLTKQFSRMEMTMNSIVGEVKTLGSHMNAKFCMQPRHGYRKSRRSEVVCKVGDNARRDKQVHVTDFEDLY